MGKVKILPLSPSPCPPLSLSPLSLSPRLPLSPSPPLANYLLPFSENNSQLSGIDRNAVEVIINLTNSIANFYNETGKLHLIIPLIIKSSVFMGWAFSICIGDWRMGHGGLEIENYK